MDDKRNFVAAGLPARRPPVRVIEPDPWNDAPHLPAVAGQRVELVTTYTDRARGHLLSTAPLSVTVAAGAVVVAVAGFGAPLLSVGALLAMMGGFLVTWLTAWILHTLTSPDGVALTQSMMGYRLLREEQKERHRRMRRWEEREEEER
jgi:hypothetical protein